MARRVAPLSSHLHVHLLRTRGAAYQTQERAYRTGALPICGDCLTMHCMIAVVQRVTEASVTVEDAPYDAAIGPGLCVLLCAEEGDTDAEADWMAGKLARLRIFRDEQDRMNRSVQDVGGEALVVSQFTLAGDCSKGNRPSFIGAALPELGEALYDRVCRALQTEHNVPVKSGIFGAMMQVSLTNDGPVTLIVRRAARMD